MQKKFQKYKKLLKSICNFHSICKLKRWRTTVINPCKRLNSNNFSKADKNNTVHKTKLENHQLKICLLNNMSYSTKKWWVNMKKCTSEPWLLSKQQRHQNTKLNCTPKLQQFHTSPPSTLVLIGIVRKGKQNFDNWVNNQKFCNFKSCNF